MPSLQTTFPTLPAGFAPCASIDTARTMITAAGFDYSDTDLIADLDEGRFEWAWNIASKNASRRETRIFTPCIGQHIAWLQNPKANKRAYSTGDVLHQLFPRSNGAWIETPALTLAFVCSVELIIDLICEGSLTQLSGTKYSPGRNGAARITWLSVTQFLTTRRL